MHSTAWAATVEHAPARRICYPEMQAELRHLHLHVLDSMVATCIIRLTRAFWYLPRPTFSDTWNVTGPWLQNVLVGVHLASLSSTSKIGHVAYYL